MAPNAALRGVSGHGGGVEGWMGWRGRRGQRGRRGGADIRRGDERWHVSLSGREMKPLLNGGWQDDSR